ELEIVNWRGDEDQWLEGPSSASAPSRWMPFRKRLWVEKRDFVSLPGHPEAMHPVQSFWEGLVQQFHAVVMKLGI
ncbi:CPY1, partial [Symbiodinium pilosum]